MKRTFLALLILPLSIFVQSTVPGNSKATGNSVWNAGGAGGIWTLIQHPHIFTCGGTAGSNTVSCTLTGASGQVATTAGNLIVVGFAYFQASGASVTGTSVTGDTFTTCSGNSSAFQFAGCGYRTSATGGTTSFTVSVTATGLTGVTWSMDVELFEYQRAGGTATFDNQGFTSAGGGTCSSCTGPTFAITGASDVIIQIGGFNDSTLSGPGAPYTSPNDVESTNVNGGFLGAINQTSAPAIIWTQVSASQAAMYAIAFQ